MCPRLSSENAKIPIRATTCRATVPRALILCQIVEDRGTADYRSKPD